MVTFPFDFPADVLRLAVPLLFVPVRERVAVERRAVLPDLRAPDRVVPLLFEVVPDPPLARFALCFERPLFALLRAVDFFAAPPRPFMVRLLDELDFDADLLRVDDLFLVEVVAIEYNSSVA